MPHIISRVLKVVLIALLGLLSGVAVIAAPSDGPDFPYFEFIVNSDVADWIIAYDWMAWRSSDLVMQEPEEARKSLGSEWFCFEADETWHAVYGDYHPRSDTYETVFHYVYDDDEGFVRTTDSIDSEFLAKHGRALRNALDRLPDSVSKLEARFNTYVRTLSDGRLDVWVLPAGQPDGTLIFGGEIHYVFGAGGRQLLDERLNFKKFHAVEPDPDLELDINREENEVASVGDIFFLQSFGSQFEDVTVWTRCFLTKLVESDDEMAWIHSERNKPDCVGDPSAEAEETQKDE